MIETLWIWSGTNQWWTNGKYRITGEVVSRYPWDTVRRIYWDDTELELNKHRFEVPSHHEIARWLRGPWKPLTPEQVADILDGTPYEVVRAKND